MTLEQFIDKYSNYIDDLKFKDLHKQLIDSEDIFKLEDGVIENLNKLLREEVGFDLLYEAETDSNYTIIKNGYCEDLCTRNNSPFAYHYSTKIDNNKSTLALFNDLIDSNIHNRFHYILQSDNDKISVSDDRYILGDYSKTKSLNLFMDYSGGLFQIVLSIDFTYQDYGNFDPYIKNNICFVRDLDASFGYGFSKSYLDSDENNYAINDNIIDSLMKQIDKQILDAVKVK